MSLLVNVLDEVLVVGWCSHTARQRCSGLFGAEGLVEAVGLTLFWCLFWCSHIFAISPMTASSSGASGPDGFPAEFYQHFWDVIKGDLLELFPVLHSGQLELFE
jgi:hypothetical protein